MGLTVQSMTKHGIALRTLPSVTAELARSGWPESERATAAITIVTCAVRLGVSYQYRVLIAHTLNIAALVSTEFREKFGTTSVDERQMAAARELFWSEMTPSRIRRLVGEAYRELASVLARERRSLCDAPLPPQVDADELEDLLGQTRQLESAVMALVARISQSRERRAISEAILEQLPKGRLLLSDETLGASKQRRFHEDPEYAVLWLFGRVLDTASSRSQAKAPTGQRSSAHPPTVLAPDLFRQLLFSYLPASAELIGHVWELHYGRTGDPSYASYFEAIANRVRDISSELREAERTGWRPLEARDVSPEQSEDRGQLRLTERERRVLSLLAEQKPVNIVARELSLSENTVRGIIRRMVAKLGRSGYEQPRVVGSENADDPNESFNGTEEMPGIDIALDWLRDEND